MPPTPAMRLRHLRIAATGTDRAGRGGLGPHVWKWLLACMLLAQTLGLVHNVMHAAHATAAGMPTFLAAPAPDNAAGEAAPPTPRWLAHLFAAHEASDCRLYDQSSHGDCLPATGHSLSMPHALPALPAVFAATAPALAAALVQARGPPSLR